MDYESAIRKPFTDGGKLVLGIILSIVPIVNWIARGFMLECSGVGKSKPSKSMPEWKDLGYYFVKGFVSYVVAFVYAIPAIIVFVITASYAIGSLASIIMGAIPMGFNSMMPSQIGEELRLAMSQNWMQIIPILITAAPLVGLGLILLAIGMYLYPIGVLNYLKSKDLGKAFDLSMVTKKALTVNYLIAWIVSGVIFLAIQAVLSFIPLLGSAIAFFVAGVISWDLFGQAFREK